MKSFVSFVAALFFAAAASPASAQKGPPVGWQFGFGGGAVHQFNSDIESGGGFSVNRWFLEPSVGYAFTPRTAVALSFGYGENIYDFTGGANIAGQTPWRRIRDMRISLPVRFGVTEEISGFFIPSLRFNAESGADFDAGRTEGALAGFSYRFSDSFSIGPGVGVFSNIEGGTDVIPILLLDWDISDDLNLSTGRGFAASRGPGLTLTWDATDDVSIAIGGRYEKTQFRLNDTGIAPGGVGQDQSVPVFASIGWKPWPAASLDLVAGVELNGRLSIRNRAGAKLGKAEYDAAPFLGATFIGRF